VCGTLCVCVSCEVRRRADGLGRSPSRSIAHTELKLGTMLMRHSSFESEWKRSREIQYNLKLLWFHKCVTLRQLQLLQIVMDFFTTFFKILKGVMLHSHCAKFELCMCNGCWGTLPTCLLSLSPPPLSMETVLLVNYIEREGDLNSTQQTLLRLKVDQTSSESLSNSAGFKS
jgi:hypothetical protein